VILMTACGSEKIAIQALQRGAASYVTKDTIADELPDTLETVLQAAKVDRRRQEFLESVTELECRFALANDPSQVPVLIAHVQDYLTRMQLCDTNQRIRVGTALEEALLNGLYHGNLELSSDLRQDGGDAYESLAVVRRNHVPYRERRLHIHVRLNLTEAVFAIRDEGPGFDVSKLPDPTDPENMTKVGGRGLLLIRTFMDEAIHNATGNQLTLTWRRKAAPARRR
jgi:anti-sigma regulatory factor (Ser/Thr protein kinase)